MKKIFCLILAVSIFSFVSDLTNKFTIKLAASVQKEKAPQPGFTKVGETYHVVTTMYYAVPGQCDADPLTTADGSKIDPNKASEHKWIAMSRDMLKRWNGKFDYGDFVVIEGTGTKDGVYQIHDTMNKRYRNRIDILETKDTPLYKFNDVTLTKVIPSDETLLASI